MKNLKPNHFIKLTRQSASFLAAFLLSLPAFSGSNSGADFLKIPIGAEPASLGQAYTAVAHGINALNWNPAGIVRTPSYVTRPNVGISFSHQDQFSDNNLDHVGLIIPNHSRNSAWGIDLVRLSYADQQGRDIDRRETGSISASDMALGAAYARNIGRAQLGTQLKIIRQELAGRQANGYAMDLGLLSATPISRLSLGASVRNLGPKMKFVDEAYDLPLTFSLGSAFQVTGPLTLALDVHYKPHQRQTVLAVGTQISASSNVSLRAGYLSKLTQAITNQQEDETNRGDFGNVSGMTGGIGLQFKQFNLDYAITPFGELGTTQMLTLSTWFDDKKSEKKVFESADEPAPVAAPVVAPEPDRGTLLGLPESEDPWWPSLK